MGSPTQPDKSAPSPGFSKSGVVVVMAHHLRTLTTGFIGFNISKWPVTRPETKAIHVIKEVCSK